MRIGIMGGTFDPIHNGHLLIAEQARGFLSLDKIIFIPSGRPPHKMGRKIIDGKTRLEMLELAISDNEYFIASDMEIKRPGKTYTIDTLLEVKQEYGLETDIYFIIGSDTLFELESWKSWVDVNKNCSFVLMKRPGFETVKEDKHINLLLEKYNSKIINCDSSTIDISSSTLREKLRNGKTVRYLIPDTVLDYINRNRIYF